MFKEHRVGSGQNVAPLIPNPLLPHKLHLGRKVPNHPPIQQTCQPAQKGGSNFILSLWVTFPFHCLKNPLV